MPFQTHNPRQSDEWTEERVALALKLDAENELSRSQIAERLRVETGANFSRNAIIGKLMRLGVPKKEPNSRPSVRADKIKERIYRPKKTWVRPVVKEVASEPARESLKLSLMQLTETTCRFPTSLGDAPIEFCGHPVSQRIYCAIHYRRCYYAPAPRTPEGHRLRIIEKRKFRENLIKVACEAA